MTYREHYETHLESLTMSGGTVEEMDTVVAELNALGNTTYRPSAFYDKWLAGLRQLTCADCGDPFTPKGPHAPAEDALCARCTTRKADASADE